ncbi:MAG: TetR/AcrR family transcriptional regulator [Candidatus Binataceae bacterium]
MGLREEKKEYQRRQIIEVAIALFRERGYDRTRVQDIIAKLRISEATFFNYFSSKDELLHEFVLDWVEGASDLLRRELTERARSVSDRVRDYVKAIASGWSKDREFMTVVLQKSNLFAATGRLREKELATYGLLSDLFKEGQERGEIRSELDPNQLAEMLTGIYLFTGGNWLVRWWQGTRGSLEARLLNAVDIFLRGCQTKSGTAGISRAKSASGRRRARTTHIA